MASGNRITGLLSKHLSCPPKTSTPVSLLREARSASHLKSNDQQSFPTANHMVEAPKLNHLWPNLLLNSTMCLHFTYHRWFVVNQNTQNSVCQSHGTWYANICLVRWKQELSPDLQLDISTATAPADFFRLDYFMLTLNMNASYFLFPTMFTVFFIVSIADEKISKERASSTKAEI